MTENVEDRENTLEWMTSGEMTLAGHVARGPEIDYGMRWGRHGNVRVSFAPTDGDGNGFLYVHDTQRRRYALLVASATFVDVDAAWRTMINRPVQSNDYLDMANLVATPVGLDEARTMWKHCIEQEFAARRVHEAAAYDDPARFEAAHAVVIAQAARVASEQLVTTAVSAADRTGFGPASVSYRILGRDGWTGKVAGASVVEAAKVASELHEVASTYGYDMQATALRRGHVALAASRVPELRELSHPIHESPFLTM